MSGSLNTQQIFKQNQRYLMVQYLPIIPESEPQNYKTNEIRENKQTEMDSNIILNSILFIDFTKFLECLFYFIMCILLSNTKTNTWPNMKTSTRLIFKTLPFCICFEVLLLLLLLWLLLLKILSHVIVADLKQLCSWCWPWTLVLLVSSH